MFPHLVTLDGKQAPHVAVRDKIHERFWNSELLDYRGLPPCTFINCADLIAKEKEYMIQRHQPRPKPERSVAVELPLDETIAVLTEVTLDDEKDESEDEVCDLLHELNIESEIVAPHNFNEDDDGEDEDDEEDEDPVSDDDEFH